MGKWNPPIHGCSNCGRNFTWLFVDSIAEGDIYECEHCNNLVLKPIEVIEADTVRADNDN